MKIEIDKEKFRKLLDDILGCGGEHGDDTGNYLIEEGEKLGFFVCREATQEDIDSELLDFDYEIGDPLWNINEALFNEK